MDRKEVIRSITRECGTSFPNVSQIARYMGRGRDWVRNNVVDDLECLTQGKSRCYFVNDVATKIMGMRG